jgi:hypothetical protein
MGYCFGWMGTSIASRRVRLLPGLNRHLEGLLRPGAALPAGPRT